MISLLNKRMINGKSNININIYPKIKNNIDMGYSQPILSFVVDEYIVISTQINYNVYNICVYSKITYNLLKTIKDLNYITIITEIRPGYIIFTTTGNSKIEVYEINLKTLKHYEILKDYIIICPGFIEVSDNEYDKTVLIYCISIYYLIDSNFDLCH